MLIESFCAVRAADPHEFLMDFYAQKDVAAKGTIADYTLCIFIRTHKIAYCSAVVIFFDWNNSHE
ncbi:hypothetical protein [Thalassobacterium sedimentorum]|uniref:hypothetical protein n=1 Tax=Thalassobacterium sedimentorum TaxID=3041258 RepID=UPI002810A6E4|nr:hypothetical protein [Coraliomargarita sp. SDUM461004]